MAGDSFTRIIPPSAFLGVPRLRHVIVEEGVHIVGALAGKLSPPSDCQAADHSGAYR